MTKWLGGGWLGRETVYESSLHFCSTFCKPNTALTTEVYSYFNVLKCWVSEWIDLPCFLVNTWHYYLPSMPPNFKSPMRLCLTWDHSNLRLVPFPSLLTFTQDQYEPILRLCEKNLPVPDGTGPWEHAEPCQEFSSLLPTWWGPPLEVDTNLSGGSATFILLEWCFHHPSTVTHNAL